MMRAMVMGTEKGKDIMLSAKDIECIVEAVLFAAGEPVSLDKLADICGQDKGTMNGLLGNYANRLHNTASGIALREMDTGWQLYTKPMYADYITQLENVRKSSGLSQAAYETLSIVAYRQPVTRAVIEQIRGVSSDGVLLKLQEKNLVKEAGRDDTPGKPFLFETTTEFLRIFGFRSVKDLPKLEMGEGEMMLDSLPID